MDLATAIPHLRNSTIDVGGRVFQIENGILLNVPEPVAKQLLAQNGAWVQYTPRQPVPAGQRPKLTPIFTKATDVPPPPEPPLEEDDDVDADDADASEDDETAVPDAAAKAAPKARRGRRAAAV